MAQGEMDNWFFGIQAGLNFSSGTPEVIAESSINSIEACASISDSEGNLLFYSQGNKVFNRNHDEMLNGNLHGYSRNATQGTGIAPMPGDPDKYYVFSMRYIGEMYGLDYAIVDMIRDFNRGEVIQRGNFLRDGITEKMTFVQQTDSPNVWLIVHDFNADEYIVFPISESGIGECTTYATGIIHTERYGYLQPSPDGSMLAAAVRTGFHSDGFVEISRFDPTEGNISESFVLQMPNRPYGICFSPDNSKLYVTSGSPNHLYQFDLSQREPDLIQASRVQITSTPFIDYLGSAAALQLAPNGKIYLARYETNWLAVINEPNALGTNCDYVQDAVSLEGTGSCEGGLPNFGNLFYDQTPAYILDDPETDEPPIEVEPEYDCEALLAKPNPTKGALILESFGDEISFVEVYDITGRVVMPETTYHSAEVRIDEMQHLASGTYIVRVAHGDCLNEKKVVVAR
ncbi:T9SS type A sorting domain-containing protein [Cryomorphaceae bacterium 1068]|nr:T9SS type A sorting domain-containing protein [Cryomorphaceae bacterium 1068]